VALRTKNTKTKIMVFGTFDIVHPGHENFFKQARDVAKESNPNAVPFLIVSLARENNIKRIKGKLPRTSEKVRLKRIKSLPEVNKVVLGAIGDHMPHIIKENPDIIALGYDQRAYVRGLKTELKKSGLATIVVRLKPYKPHKYKTSILQKKSL
jgi:FAD synthetase